MLARCGAAGIDILEGCDIREGRCGDEGWTLVDHAHGTRRVIRASYVVDATGRAAATSLQPEATRLATDALVCVWWSAPAADDAEGAGYEVWVRAFPDNGKKVQISNAGGLIPRWSRTGQLFYRTEDQRIMVADYTVKAGVFKPEKPRLWSRMKLADMGTAVNLDLDPHGKRFIALLPAERPQPAERQSHVMLVTNFFDEVRRRMAGQGK